MTTRGYYGIGIEHPKTEVNLGTLWRTAFNLGAAFIFTIGRRYRSQSSDTTKSWRHIPLYHHESFDSFFSTMPKDCRLVGVEYPCERAHPLKTYIHPERAIYLLGAEDHGMTKKALAKCHEVTFIPSSECLNVAVAGSIVMYDRLTKPLSPRMGHGSQ